MNRRKFNFDIIKGVAAMYVATPFLACKAQHKISVDNAIKISLAEWSLHRAIKSGQLDHLDFAGKAQAMGFSAVEYVSQFFDDKVNDTSYLKEMNKRAEDNGVDQLLIMVDLPEKISNLNSLKRKQAVEKHYPWIDAAKYLNCHSIRVNLFGLDKPFKIAQASVEGLSQLGEYAKPLGINIIVENHGQLSSNGKWLANVIKEVDASNVGTLPDFGNFCLEREGGVLWGAKCISTYDKYVGVEELMPFAKAVSAKSFDFKSNGEEESIDYKRMIDIVKKYNYTGYIGIEYEGSNLSEEEGILKTKALLEKYI